MRDIATKGYGDSILSTLASVFGSWSARTSDVALTTSNTWYSGPSISLDAGSYVVIAQLANIGEPPTAESIFGRLTNGSTHYSFWTILSPIGSCGAGGQLILIANVTLASTTTITAQMTSSGWSLYIGNQSRSDGQWCCNNAPQIVAIRVDGQAQVAGRYSQRITFSKRQETFGHIVALWVKHRDSIDTTPPIHVIREPDSAILRELVSLSYDELKG